MWALLVLTLATVVAPTLVQAQTPADPTGATYGTKKDVAVADANAPTLTEVMDTVGHNKVAINMVWTLITGFLVMFMQAGFAMVETGFTRAKNASHTMSMNFMVYLDGFFLSGNAYDTGVYTLFLFQMVFMDTTVTIPTGAMAERWKWTAFCIYALFMSMVVYPIFGNWVWGAGWLASLGTNFGLGHGHVDFAGSSVVHMVGGVAALAGAIVIGPRIGKFNKDGSANAIVGHDIPMAIVGTFILAFGWFGFNPGSTLSGGDFRMAIVATNSMLAGTGGALTAMLFVMFKFGKPDPSMMVNGLLAGLVAITAPCAFVSAPIAMLIGAIAGVLVVLAVFFIERTLKIDDPVGAIAVHGVNGAFGVLCVGLFADGSYGDGWNGVPGTVKGLLYGDASQFFAQLIGITTCFVFVFAAFYAFFTVCDKVVGNRVSAEVEVEGLDMDEMGALAYPDFVMK